MIVIALTVAWLGEVLAGVLFFQMVLVLFRAFLPFFAGHGSTAGWALRDATEWVVRPFRALTRRLPMRYDLAPLVAALALWVAERLVYVGFLSLAGQLAGGAVPRAPAVVVTAVAALRFVLWAYLLVVLVRVLVIWFGSPEYHPFVRFLARLVDPALSAIRVLVRPRYGRIDFAPVVLLAGLWFVDRVVLESLLYLL